MLLEKVLPTHSGWLFTNHFVVVQSKNSNEQSVRCMVGYKILILNLVSNVRRFLAKHHI